MSAKEHSRRLSAFEIGVRNTIKKHHMLNPGEHVLVAVSGGADSVALLLCLHKLASKFNISLSIAHLNHKIRGKEGDEDEDFVRRLSSGMKIPFYSEAIEVKKQAIEAKLNLEEFARQKRYEFLRQTARRIGANKIAVGHNLNDQAETVLFRFIRGSGIEGLSGIYPVVDGLIIRPLLDCSREAIAGYLKHRGADFREDATNKNLQHTRNRIRMELVPYLEKNLNPKLTEAMAREALLLRETWNFIEAEAKEALSSICRKDDSGLLIDLGGVAALHPALQKQVLRQALKEFLGSLRGVTSRQIDGIASLCRHGHSGGQVRISGQSFAIRQYDTLLLTKQPFPRNRPYEYRLKIPGECRVVETGATFRAEICSTPDLKSILEMQDVQAFLAQETLPAFVSVRSKRPGDRYGGPGHRKVKKLLNDGKIPRLKRDGMPVVAAGEDVVWIPGFRPARKYAAQPESETCVRIEIIPYAFFGEL